MFCVLNAAPAAKSRATVGTTVLGRWILFAYAIFFAAVAPFICWGTAGDPSHSHAAAHFVFDEDLTVSAAHSSDSHGHDYCRHDPMLRHNRLAPDGPIGAPDSEPETRSAPIITLISLIVLLFFGAKETLFLTVRQSAEFLQSILARETLLLVPTPPPRAPAPFG